MGPKTKLAKRIEAEEERKRAACDTPPIVSRKKRARGKSKPKAVVDYKPILMKFLADKKPLDQAWEEVTRYGHSLSVRDRVNFYMSIAKLALESSPRHPGDVPQNVLVFAMDGMVHKEIRSTLVDAVDVTTEIPALPDHRLPHGATGDEAIREGAKRERERVRKEMESREPLPEDSKEDQGSGEERFMAEINRQLAEKMQKERDEATMPKIPANKGVTNA